MTTSSTTFLANDTSYAHRVLVITRAMQQVDADADMQADLDKQTVVVTSGVSISTVKAAIEQAGYPVKSSG